MTQLHITVQVVIFNVDHDSLRVLLTRVTEQTWQLPFAIPARHASLEDAAQCALAERIAQQEVYLEQLYTYGDPDRVQGQREISVVYFALVPSDAIQTASQGNFRWFALNDLPTLIHDQSEITAYALRRLRYKLEYSAVGFELLPDVFTLSELQHTYEIILGEKLDKRNFRRRILQSGIIEKTPHMRGGEGRPARLYRYQPDAVAEVKARRLFP